MLDQSLRVFMVTRIADDHTQVVQQGGCVEQNAFFGTITVEGHRLVEQASREVPNLLGVRLVVTVVSGQVGR